MRKILRGAVALAVAMAALMLAARSTPAATGPASRAARAASDARDALHWLEGCWARDDAGHHFELRWTGAVSGTLGGTRRETSDGSDTVSEERESITRRGDRFAIAVEAGGQAAELPAVERADARIVFEGRNADERRRIGYERVSANVLRHWTESVRHGATVRVSHTYHRVACPGPAGGGE